MSDPTETSQPTSAPSPSPETQRLGALVGRWRSEGHVVGDAPVPISGTDTYECAPSDTWVNDRRRRT